MIIMAQPLTTLRLSGSGARLEINNALGIVSLFLQLLLLEALCVQILFKFSFSFDVSVSIWSWQIFITECSVPALLSPVHTPWPSCSMLNWQRCWQASDTQNNDLGWLLSLKLLPFWLRYFFCFLFFVWWLLFLFLFCVFLFVWVLFFGVFFLVFLF